MTDDRRKIERPRTDDRRPPKDIFNMKEVGFKFEKLEVENLEKKERFIIDGYDGVFVFIGYDPQTEIYGDLIEKDKYGYFITDENMATKLNGIYAAGDIRSKKYRQITTAVSDGTIAALEAEKYLKANY